MNSRKFQTLALFYYFMLFSCLSKELTAQEDVNSNLIESANYSDSNSVLSIRTERIDPLDNFMKYTGGYNISNNHYWSSTIFTGKYGYVFATLWILCGISLVVLHVISRICFSKKEKDQRKFSRTCSQRIDLLFIVLTVFFITLIIIESSFALTGSVRFHARAESIKRIISRTASDASGTLFNVSKTIESMQNINYIYEGLQNSTDLNSTAQSLSEEASDIQRKADESMQLVNSGINILEIVTVITLLVNLVAILALLVVRPLKFNRLFYWTIILCWISTSFLWMYFGLYLFLAEFWGDTCIALDEYQLNPENSSLGSILPCSGKANIILQDVGISIHDLIDQVNGKIFTLRSSEIAELQFVCNPFSGPPNYIYQPDNCSSSTINIGDIPQALRRYACLETDETACAEVKYIISQTEFEKIQIYTNTIQNIIDVFPSTERLVDCQLVKESFSEIILNECEPLKKYAKLTWASLLILSIIMIILIIIWISQKIHDEKYHVTDGLVNPHLSSASSSEFDAREAKLEP